MPSRALPRSRLSCQSEEVAARAPASSRASRAAECARTRRSSRPGFRRSLAELLGIADRTSRSCLPQTISVGASIRWIRFASPLSGIGQTNFVVQPSAHDTARDRGYRCIGVGGRCEDRPRCLALRIEEEHLRQLLGRGSDPVATGRSSRQRPIGSSRTRSAEDAGEVSRELASEHPAERRADCSRPVQPQLAGSPPRRRGRDPRRRPPASIASRIARRRARHQGRIDVSLLREAFEERIPVEPGSRVEEEQRWPLAGRSGRGARGGRSRPRRPRRDRVPISESDRDRRPRRRCGIPVGHHSCSHPSSCHIGLRAGSTSSANSWMFFSVRSCGMPPIWSITSRLPIRNSLTNARACHAPSPGFPRSRHGSRPAGRT